MLALLVFGHLTLYVFFDVEFLQSSILLLVSIRDHPLFHWDIYLPKSVVLTWLLEPRANSKVTLLRIEFSLLEGESLHKLRSRWCVDKVLNRWAFVNTFGLCLRLLPFAGPFQSIFPNRDFLNLLYVTAKHLLVIHWKGLVVVRQNRRHLYLWHLEFGFLLLLCLLRLPSRVWLRFLDCFCLGSFILKRSCLSVASLVEGHLFWFLPVWLHSVAWRLSLVFQIAERICFPGERGQVDAIWVADRAWRNEFLLIACALALWSVELTQRHWLTFCLHYYIN